MNNNGTDAAYSAALNEINLHFATFHKQGAKAYRPGLETIRILDEAFGNPSRSFSSIHIGGTNGKGSTASTIAAVLSAAGYRTGLYTSPHLLDFRERIRVDGEMVSRRFVVEFMKQYGTLDLPVRPSFFELTTAMAFSYFAQKKVDVAVIEVGLGGRLDSTNIITPEVSVITNISPDHMAILGNTEEAIAAEKAGIIKPGVPVVIGNATGGVRQVFLQTAEKNSSPIVFAQDNPLCSIKTEPDGSLIFTGTPWGDIRGGLHGAYQQENTATVLNTLVLLSSHFDINPAAVSKGFAEVVALSGLRGRWMSIEAKNRKFLCDTGHNVGAWRYIGPALRKIASGTHLRMVLGFLSDKDLEAILPYMPREADYYFVAPDGERARSAESTATIFAEAGIGGLVCGNIPGGIEKAAGDASAGDLIFVGGSTFVVSAFLNWVEEKTV